jgi:hypothetical protein
VLRRHASYRPSRGKPEQWLSGVIRLEVKRFLRAEHKHPWPTADDQLAELAVDAWTPEAEVSLRDLVERRLAMLPDEERRVVILVEIERLTFREAARREGISASTAFERHKRGMAALRDAASREDQAWSGVLVFPLVMGSSDPSADFAEQAWQRAVLELGLHDLPEVEPPDGGVPARPMLGAMAAAGAACMLGGVILGRCMADRPRDERPPAILVEAPPSNASATAAIEAAPIADVKPAASVVGKGHEKGERELLRLARIAIEQRHAARAVALLAQVRSARFAALRDRLREDALAVGAPSPPAAEP